MPNVGIERALNTQAWRALLPDGLQDRVVRTHLPPLMQCTYYRILKHVSPTGKDIVVHLTCHPNHPIHPIHPVITIRPPWEFTCPGEEKAGQPKAVAANVARLRTYAPVMMRVDQLPSWVQTINKPHDSGRAASLCFSLRYLPNIRHLSGLIAGEEGERGDWGDWGGWPGRWGIRQTRYQSDAALNRRQASGIEVHFPLENK
ncbi:hypothetical protein GGR50DRAFT_652890 [Xylaria sp. CBS 124048]|nr:hypothetical protein GGR50DRAFT_652890 [Xylaria sp. CBS 124048]